MEALFATSFVLNVVLATFIYLHRPWVSREKVPKIMRHRRGIVNRKLVKDKKDDVNVTALIEEVENLGDKSIVKYLEISGIDSDYHKRVAEVIGTILDHNQISWVKNNRETVFPTKDDLNAVIDGIDKKNSDVKTEGN